MAAGKCSFPASLVNLKILSRGHSGSYFTRPLPLQEQRAVVIRLSKDCPRLEELTLGVYRSVWTRSGDIWQEPGEFFSSW